MEEKFAIFTLGDPYAHLTDSGLNLVKINKREFDTKEEAERYILDFPDQFGKHKYIILSFWEYTRPVG